MPKAAKPKKPQRVPRAVKFEQTRKALVAAAADIIGEEGYQACSVAKIALRAKVGQGTFYTYFSSRDELFDQLLPEIGGEMRAFLRDKTKGARDLLEFEERSYDAFFAFLHRMPGYHRLFSEAETLAQGAFARHLQAARNDYMKLLRLAMSRGELERYGEDELETLAVILIALRSFIGPRFIAGDHPRRMPAKIRKTYLKFLEHGLGSPARK